MNVKCRQKGFTLIELLIASAIIMSIVSMVYGTYFVVSKSTQNTKARIELFEQGCDAIELMGGQIRCSYINAEKIEELKNRPPSQESKSSGPDYFTSRPTVGSSEILHLVTTKGLDNSEGLFEVTYRLERDNRLYFKQKRFTGDNKDGGEFGWQAVLENIESINLEFYEDGVWLKEWSFNEKQKLPKAVKIEIVVENEMKQEHTFSTVAYVCSNLNDDKKQTKESIVAKGI